MTKWFQQYTDPSDNRKKHRSMLSTAIDTMDRKGVYALGVAPLNLQGIDERFNAQSSFLVSITANTPLENVHWRPSYMFREFCRTRDTTSGNMNPSTNHIDLDNPSGVHNNGDVFVITWVQDGDQNDNLNELVLWLGASATDANSDASFVRVSLFDITALANNQTGELVNLAAGVGVTPLNLDMENYATAALAYAQVPFNDVNLIANGGGPVTFNLRYNAHEDNGGLVDGNVYAIAIYLDVDAADSTNHIAIYGSEDADHDPSSATYVGVAGWNGALGVDNTCQSAFHVLRKTSACVINNISVEADSGQTLGDILIPSISVVPDEDAEVYNVQELPDNQPEILHSREIATNVKIGDRVTMDIIYEGKTFIERRYFLKMILFPTYTGDITFTINYWNDPRGDA